MLHRIAWLALTAPRRVIAVAALVLIAAAMFGVPVANHLSAGGFPGSRLRIRAGQPAGRQEAPPDSSSRHLARSRAPGRHARRVTVSATGTR